MSKKLAIITIGHDCQISEFVKYYLGLHVFSSPFEWNITKDVKTVIDIINHNFDNFITENINYLLAFTIIIVALCTVAIVSMDLGTPYSKSELKLYNNKIFQTIAAFSVSYSITEDIYKSLFVSLLWLGIKYS